MKTHTHYFAALGLPLGEHESFLLGLRQMPFKVGVREMRFYEVSPIAEGVPAVEEYFKSWIRPDDVIRARGRIFSLLGRLFSLFWRITGGERIRTSVWVRPAFNTRGVILKFERPFAKFQRDRGEML